MTGAGIAAQAELECMAAARRRFTKPPTSCDYERRRVLLEAVRDAYAAGLCVIPPKPDGSKAPIVAWKQYQVRRSTVDELRAWYRQGLTGLGVVPGAVSGNLEVIEFDDKGSQIERFRIAAENVGLGGLVRQLDTGYLERSPSGGFHWLYRCDAVGRNRRLASRPKTPDEMKHPGDRVQVLIETRAEGGYVILAPSYGAVHPSGEAYQLVAGGLRSIPTLSGSQRDALFELAATFDQMPRKSIQPVSRDRHFSGTRPGDLFGTTVTWEDILVPHGWRALFTNADGIAYWRRPGKEMGVSATTNYAASGLLYVFSTSTPFEPERGYSKFSALAVLNFGGDHKAAARALVSKGYVRVRQVYRPLRRHHPRVTLPQVEVAL